MTNYFAHADRFALVNGRLVLPDQVLEGCALVVRDGLIEALAAPDDLGTEVLRVDVVGRLVTPGLIDLHTHGALGHTFNQPDAAAWGAIVAENARRGVTGLLATLVTAPLADLTACLDFCRQWMAVPGPGARVLGAHVEGPYLSPAQKGAQDPRYMRPPGDGTAGMWAAYRDVLRIMALAPELPGALELVANLSAAGIIPAAGHSNARDTQVAAAIAAGLRHITHVWSGQSVTVREGPWRRPGLLEASLAFDGLTVEMICDNRHLPATLMRLACKAIGPDRLCAVSDASGGAGLPEGARFRMGPMEYEVSGGAGMMLDGSGLAGSTTLLNEMLPVLTGVVGLPLPQAVRMVTLNPARVLGLDGRQGSIVPGKVADLAAFNDDFTVWRTMIGGRRAYAQDLPSAVSRRDT